MLASFIKAAPTVLQGAQSTPTPTLGHQAASPAQRVHRISHRSDCSEQRVSSARVRVIMDAAASPVTAPAPTSSISSSPGPTYVTEAARNGLFGSAVEQVDEVEAPVTGTLPSWLSGSLLLNGGADYTGMQHLFDGYAMVSKLRIEGGRVYGSQRFIQTEAYRQFKKTGKMKYREFATPIPSASTTQWLGNLAGNMAALATKIDAFTDNASVNLLALPDGKMLAMSEPKTSLYRMSPANLATLEQVQLKDSVPGDMTTAHPKVLPDGRIINFSRTLPFGGFYVYRQDPHTLVRTQIAYIPDRSPLAPAWVHDMAASNHHLVICECPLYFHMPSLILGTSREFTFMDWSPEHSTKVHVITLDGSQPVRTYEAPAFWTFHYVGAFESEDGGELYVDFGVYEDPTILNQLSMPALREFPGTDVDSSPLSRLTIPLRTPPAEAGLLQPPQRLLPDDAAYGSFFEFPAINPHRKGQSYRYVWAMCAARPTNMGNALAKHDLQAGTSVVWHEAGSLPGEVAFLPSPGAGAAEDDGVLLSVVMSATGTSFLLVLDASSMKEVARAPLPFAVPYRFHGVFMPSVGPAVPA